MTDKELLQQEIKIKLTIGEFNYILTKLEDCPHREVKGLIGKIKTQGDKQADKILNKGEKEDPVKLTKVEKKDE